MPRGRSQPASSTDSTAPDGATSRELEFVRGVLRHESGALDHLATSLDARFSAAVDLIEKCAGNHGTLLVSGLGKSGHIGAKISATLASLGIPSHAVHPSEAAHGDLGRFRPSDLALCLSYSGETAEVVNLAAILRQDGLPIISITGMCRPGSPSSLERLATVALDVGVEEEAAGDQFAAPTTSTTSMLALGDALALAAARRHKFTHADFAKRHPGGTLGGLLRPVTEVLRFRVGENLPVVPDALSVSDALQRSTTTGRRPGAMVLVDAKAGTLSGIFTDGDLRRLVMRGPGELSRPIAEVMTRAPRTLPESASVADAVRMVREHRQDEIPVVDSAGRPVGVLDVQDLIAMRLVSDA